MSWTQAAVALATQQYQVGDGFEEIAREMRRRGFDCARAGGFGGENVRRKLIQSGVHTPKPIRTGPIAEWLQTQIEPCPHTSCLLWTGRVNEKGYGTTGDGRLAHRAVWEEIALRPLPDGVELHHTCRNRRCVNIKHLLPIDSAKLHARLHRREASIEDLTLEQLADAAWLFTDEQLPDLPSRVGALDPVATRQFPKIGTAG